MVMIVTRASRDKLRAVRVVAPSFRQHFSVVEEIPVDKSDKAQDFGQVKVD
jgi:hypothetical protein